MECTICRHGETRPGAATVTLLRGGTTVIIKDVPANICENCGEYYLEGSVTQRTLDIAEDAARKGAEVEVIRFAA